MFQGEFPRNSRANFSERTGKVLRSLEVSSLNFQEEVLGTFRENFLQLPGENFLYFQQKVPRISRKNFTELSGWSSLNFQEDVS